MAAASLGIYFLGVLTTYEMRDLRLVKERGCPSSDFSTASG